MKVRLSALVFLLCTAIPTFARVLSYAPFTSQTPRPGYHERTSRQFLLIESAPNKNRFTDQQLVLYDTVDQEPRDVTPEGDLRLLAAALHEADDASHQTFLLAVVVDNETLTVRTVFSSNGGSTWQNVAALHDKYVELSVFQADLGGPWAQGLTPDIRTGSDAWPFVLVLEKRGVWAISRTGEARQIDSHPDVIMAGQNASGTKFLIGEYLLSPIDPSFLRFRVVDTSGATGQVIASDFLLGDDYAGWIADDGTVYIVTTRVEGRFLYQYRNGHIEAIAGPRGATVPPYNGEDPDGPGRNRNDFLAVPTHDFNGAWMVQRGTSAPTTLLRYTPARGLETFWSDPAGPEVEALIAGPSGESVLIQVHRERSVAEESEEELRFLDPALAVWRVGEPMPRGYDELYLTEGIDKGFLHVNPDAMREGAPFVFNSGLYIPGTPTSPPPPAGGGADVIQEWGVVRSSLKQHLILPGVARLQGGFGSEWRTDVTLYNPLDEEQAVDVEYVALHEPAASPRTITVTLKAHELRFVPDALQSFFLLETGGGSLHFHPAAAINVVGRTYSRSGNGTYGFGMTAIDALTALGSRFPLTFAGAFPGEHFRTNILLTDTSGRGTAATLSAFGVLGSIGSNGSIVTAPAGGTSQANGINGSLNLLQRDAGGLVIQPTRGTAIATVVAIDNRTNDPTHFPPDLTPAGVRTIPVIGHLPGANGSQFRSDLYLFNPAAETRIVTLEAKKWDSAVLVTRQFTLRAREARVIPDALLTLWNLEGLARLRYSSDVSEDGVRVTSRTYTIDESGATYGSLIPPLNNFQIAPSGDALEIIGATAGPGFRTNVGLVELSAPSLGAAPTTVRIRLIDQDHHELDSFTVTLQRAAGIQINNLFASRGIAQPAAAMIAVEVLDEGLIGAYATLTDNTTNDTTYLGAQLAAKSN